VSNIKPINTKAPGDCGYVAGYQGKTIALYAAGLFAAKEKAVEHLKVTRKNAGLLWVNLAERADGSTVLQSTCL